MLYGRDREQEVLDRHLAQARAGRSSVLVLRGEAGVGKTALLEYVAEQASGCRVARAAGVESEMELAFAGLHQLCAPLLDRLERLPGPQRDALRTAFGLSAGGAPDRFLVGLAVLSLLADVAEERPLVCLVDDAQWLDRASAQALAFVARRLLAERVAMVFAVREPDDAGELDGLPELVVDGLGDDDARALLGVRRPRAARRAGPRPDRRRDARQPAGAAGAAARADAGASSPAGSGCPTRVPLSSRIEQSFLRRLEALPAETQRLLLIAGGRAGRRRRRCSGARPSASASGPTRPSRPRRRADRARRAGAVPASARALGGLPGGAACTNARRRIARWPRRPIPRSIPTGARGTARTRRPGPTRRVAAELERSADRAQARGGSRRPRRSWSGRPS